MLEAKRLPEASILYHIPMHPEMPEELKEVQIPNRVMMWFYSALLAVGVIQYVVWGLLFGSWNIFHRENLGVYTATVLLCGFGIVGMLLCRIKNREQ